MDGVVNSTQCVHRNLCFPYPRWMQIRRIGLRTADGLNPTPMAISWVRDGILMCAMDNEIAVYSQWRQTEEVAGNALEYEGRGENGDAADGAKGDKDIVDHRNLGEEDILNLAQVIMISQFKF